LGIDVESIRDAVRKKYAAVSHSAEGRFNYPTGKAGALALGYEPSALAGIPDDVLASFCGVGNPFSLGPVRPGDAVLDVGCGAGVDLIIAAQMVGPAGTVRGIDLTREMVERARANIARTGLTNVSVEVAGVEAIPFPDSAFDVVVSNGVLNLSPLKEQAYREICRVLRPGGRLQFADITLKEELPPEVASSLEAWSE
jgi:SAM-dependent methyltransferase